MTLMVKKMNQHKNLNDLREERCGRKVTVQTPVMIQWVLTIITGDILSIPGDPVNTARRNNAGLDKSTWNKITKTDLKMHPFKIVKRQKLSSP